MIQLTDIKKVYHSGEHIFTALRHISLIVPDGEFLAICGPSGSGKTTLLNIIGGMDTDYSGTVMIDGFFLSRISDKQLADVRKEKISVIYQDFNLLPSLSVKENITLCAKLKGTAIDQERYQKILRQLELTSKENHFMDQLSRGQQQRVAIARALLSETKIILADEPTGNLDSKNSEIVFHLLKELSKEHHRTVIVITHDEKLAETADRIVRIRDGELYE